MVVVAKSTESTDKLPGSIFTVAAEIEKLGVQALPVQVHVPSVLLAFFVAFAVGVLFGWYPARRAALMDPIEALRHE